jgi:hypothetical protein
MDCFPRKPLLPNEEIDVALRDTDHTTAGMVPMFHFSVFNCCPPARRFRFLAATLKLQRDQDPTAGSQDRDLPVKTELSVGESRCANVGNAQIEPSWLQLRIVAGHCRRLM